MSAFVLGADGAYRLITDWHRYSGQRRYCLVFAAAPRWDCLRYSLRRADGTVYATVTAAQLLSWHFSQLRQAGESVVFAPVKGTVPSRLQRQEWLREALLAALPLEEGAARALVRFVSPHAFRAGLAGDLHRAGVAWQAIQSWCRWETRTAMLLYALRPELFAASSSFWLRMVPNVNGRD